MINPLWNLPGDIIITDDGSQYEFDGSIHYVAGEYTAVYGYRRGCPHTIWFREEIPVLSVKQFGKYKKENPMSEEVSRKGDRIRALSGNRYIYDGRADAIDRIVCHSIDDEYSIVHLRRDQIAEVVPAYEFPTKDGLYRDNEGRVWLMVHNSWTIIRTKNGTWLNTAPAHTPVAQDGWNGDGIDAKALPMRYIKDIVIDTNGDNTDACGLYA